MCSRVICRGRALAFPYRARGFDGQNVALIYLHFDPTTVFEATQNMVGPRGAMERASILGRDRGLVCCRSDRVFDDCLRASIMW